MDRLIVGAFGGFIFVFLVSLGVLGLVVFFGVFPEVVFTGHSKVVSNFLSENIGFAARVTLGIAWFGAIAGAVYGYKNI